jgi:hypothetical protein
MKWDSDELWKKARLYMEKANQCRHDSTDFPLWSALALELLARAALTKIHPVLNADAREDVNVLYGCGVAVTEQPKSLPVHSVFLRLEKTVKGFGKVQRELCDYISILRNDELHSAGLPFEKLKESVWLPRYYDVCKVLCEHLCRPMEELLGDDVAKSASLIIKSLAKKALKSVKVRISAHEKVFKAKDDKERRKLRDDAENRTRFRKHGTKRHDCPACGSHGLLRGELIKELQPFYEEEHLYVDEELLAVEFKCPACELHLANPEEIAYSSIEPRFRDTRITDLHEMFEAEEEDPYMNM